jgi:predicted Zn-dependent protease
MADWLTFRANTEFNAWIAKRGPVGVEKWMGVQADLKQAEELAESDPQPPELLGALHLYVTGRVGSADVALGHLMHALELRPSSPYTWVNLAQAHYRLGMTTGAFERILLMTQRLGPSEPETQRLLADIGLAMWDDIGVEARSAVRAAVIAGMRRNPLEMLQISERRGRLALACAHVPGDKRIRDPKWIKVCSREAR